MCNSFDSDESPTPTPTPTPTATPTYTRAPMTIPTTAPAATSTEKPLLETVAREEDAGCSSYSVSAAKVASVTGLSGEIVRACVITFSSKDASVSLPTNLEVSWEWPQKPKRLSWEQTDGGVMSSNKARGVLNTSTRLRGLSEAVAVVISETHW
mmetsp:Transcript_240/g.229  ORF Transcript_240/g.229 Transcript_240/m.229 type:complete len:154 (-) Transcript_240:355-816(-)